MRALIGRGLGILLLHGSVVSAAENGVIRVGSKSFTESYILAEIAAQVIERVGEAQTRSAPRDARPARIGQRPAGAGAASRWAVRN